MCIRIPCLTQLIHTALQQNYDVRIAATRVLEAQAQLGITRANQFPSASVGAGVFSQQNAKVSSLFPAYEVNAGQLNLSVIWNLDFWGKYRRQTEESRAQLLATKWGQQAVISSLVANVATAYFQLRALDAELEIAKRTLGSRQQSLQLTQVLETHGSASDLDVSQSEQLVYTASETIPDLERQIEQQENALSILLGENPGSIPRGNTLTEQPVPDSVPTGLPSELLERRPDVREAEANMMAANAQIGVAKASFFPSISLTGTGGLESNALHQFLQRTIPDLERRPEYHSARLRRRSAPLATQARSSTVAGKQCSPTSRLYRTRLNKYRMRLSRMTRTASSASSRNCSLKRRNGRTGSRWSSTRTAARVISKC